MSSRQQRTPLVLLILDGWGVDGPHAHNAIESAQKPHWDHWWTTMPHGLLEASGLAVGLPEGQIGNSEVGHMHLGAGRLIMQDLTKINDVIKRGVWDQEPSLRELFESANRAPALHVMGLLSTGGVHSHEDHLFEFLKLCHRHQLQSIRLHLFLDGRDTSPRSALASLDRLDAVLAAHPVGRVVSVSGRYFAMDRDQRWARVEKAYDVLTQGTSERFFASAQEAVNFYYSEDIDDEFIPPTRIGDPIPMQDGDVGFFFNFRSDRARELTQALIDPNFSGFSRQTVIHFKCFFTMTAYQDHEFSGIKVGVLFPPHRITHPLGEVIAAHGLTQLRIAETEKYAHVTFFLNGGQEALYPGEDRTLIPSPQVATYDLQPEMSARLITEKLLEVIAADRYDVILCNFANADMVGHTGDMQAAIRAIECLDDCMAQVVAKVHEKQGYVVITSDHGNAEVMFDESTQQPHTAHTQHLVPFLLIGQGWRYVGGTGSLVDVAPTLLTLLGLPKPEEMTGRSLLEKIE
jgi:2,3-bisphosphoglycerate-independent phosphoglycerate mutase